MRPRTASAEDLALLEDVDAAIRVVSSDDAGHSELVLEGAKVPEALRQRDPGAVVAYQLVVFAPKRLGLVLRTGRGPIGVDDRDGPVEAHTDSGHLQLERLRGDTKAFSGRGNHAVIDHEGGLDLSTAHGTILAYVAGLAEGGVTLRNDSGSIQCNLPPESNFELNASTAMGEIETPFGLDPEDRDRGQTLVGTVGEPGGPPVRIEAKRGSLSIRRHAREPG